MVPWSFSATNPTAVTHKVLNYLNVLTKRCWNGNDFFGLHREDVQKTLKSASSQVLPAEIETITPDIKNNSHHTCAWVGVLSVGNIEVCKNFTSGFLKKIGNKKVLYFPPGYEAARNIKLTNSQTLTLYCKVQQKDNNNIPIFTCYTKEHIIFSICSENISKVVKDALLKLGISSTRRWSGFDFFGITRSDVVSYFEKALHQECATTSSGDEVKAKNLSKVLKTVLDIRHRNAGPTKSLTKRAQNERNEKIHKLVEFASFGDVTGLQLKICLISLRAKNIYVLFFLKSFATIKFLPYNKFYFINLVFMYFVFFI